MAEQIAHGGATQQARLQDTQALQPDINIAAAATGGEYTLPANQRPIPLKLDGDVTCTLIQNGQHISLQGDTLRLSDPSDPKHPYELVVSGSGNKSVVRILWDAKHVADIVGNGLEPSTIGRMLANNHTEGTNAPVVNPISDLVPVAYREALYQLGIKGCKDKDGKSAPAHPPLLNAAAIGKAAGIAK